MIEFTGERVIPGRVNADLWAEHFSRYAFAARLATAARVLDIGCGTGYGTAELAQTSLCALGIDPAHEAIAHARSEYRQRNLCFMQGSAERLPFQDRSFDLVTAFEVIEHLSEWPSMLAEAKRVLKPHGVCVISTPNKAYYNQSRGETGPNPFHKHEFEADEFVFELRKHFPEVQLLLQNRVAAIAFYPYNTFYPVDARLDGSRGTPSDAHFLIALCSNEPIRNLRSFVYVPRAANVLWEREQHIASLEQELAAARHERDVLIEQHETLNHHLEAQNRWGRELDAELATKREHLAVVLKELEQTQELLRKTSNALNGEIDRLRGELKIAVEALDKAEQTVIERTLWAKELQQNNEELRQKIEHLTASRWHKLGLRLGFGPAISEDTSK